MGFLSVYSSSLHSGNFTNLEKNIAFFAVGFFLMFLFSFFDWRIFRENPYLILILYFFSIALLFGLYFFAPATRGGIKFTGTSCHGSMYRKVEKPCFFERGIPIGMQMVVVDPVHQARFQAAMSVDSFTGSQNLQPDVNVTGYTLLVATSGPYEQTLDLVTPTNIAQAITVERQAYKGGIFKLGVKLKGWEMPGAWKSWCQKNLPQLLAGSSAAPSGSTAMVNQ